MVIWGITKKHKCCANKRMQPDASKAGAADAGRYKALERDQVKVHMDCMSRLNHREYGAAEKTGNQQ